MVLTHIVYSYTYNLLGEIMKYFKTIIFELILLFSLNLISTCFYYFNILSSNANSIIKIIIFIITFLFTGIYIGRKSNKKYYFEGLKISSINIIIFILLSLIFKYKYNIYTFIYYLIIILITVLGSIIGGNIKKNKS